MSQRIPLDRGSFKLGLSTFFQRLHGRGLRPDAVEWSDPKTLPDLLHIQQKIEGDELDLAAVMDRVVKVAWRELGADGAGVWLFTNNEIFFCAGAGNASNDERLRLTVLSTLAATHQLRKPSRTPPGAAAKTCAPSSAAGPASSYAKSLLIEPISQGQKITGVFAAFSSELERFAERDAAKIQFLADLLAKALGRVADHSYVALEPVTMLELVEGMIPALQNMLNGDESSYNFTNGFGRDAMWKDREPVPPSLPDDSATSVLHWEASPAGGPTNCESDSAESPIVPSQIRSKWDGAVGFVRNGPSRVFGALRVAATGSAKRIEHVVRQVWQAVHFRTPRPTLQLDLGSARRFLFEVWAGANSHLKVWFQPRRHLTAIPVLAVLLTAIAFLTLKTGHHWPGQTKASGPTTTGVEKNPAADAGPPAYREIARSDESATITPTEAHVAQQAAMPSPTQVSHLRVTDRATQEALRTLSQYELAALRRRAFYGDDFAEFLIGMAYESGHGVRQDCKAAADWVTKAASEGNPAAEYNLGLRYRDGDGVPMDQDAALTWLRKAAARHVFGAQVALMAVAPQ
jgi:hypothetical protein